MRPRWLLLIVLVTVTAPVARPQAAGTAAGKPSVDAIFEKWAGTRSPGCAVAVSKDGATVVERAYGMADLEHGVANTPDTVFEAGSIAKQFTATAAVLLARQGKLSLDDPVRKYVPEVPDYGKPITLRQMLHHTSGLRDWGVVAAAGGWPRGSRIHTHDHVLDIVSRQQALNYEPGAEYLYTNTGYNLTAVTVGRVSGQSFAEYTRTAIFEPLGMTRTSWRDDFTRIVPGRAVAYAPGRDGYHQEMPFENVHGNGGLLTTVSDLLRWNANLGQPRVGGQELAAQLEAPGRLNDGRPIGYGLGLTLADFRGVREVWHSGSTAGYRAFLARYPEHRLSVAVLCNAGEAPAPDLGRQVAATFLGDALRPLPAAAPVAAAELEARAGLYRSQRTGEPVRIAMREGSLRMDGREMVPLSGREFAIGPTRALRVRFEDGSGGEGALMRLAFPEGEVHTYERVAESAPQASALAEYAGQYVSDEAEVTYRFAVEDGKLALKMRPATSFALAPAYRDAFTGPGGFVLFRRDAQGRVEGLSLGMGRVRDLRFRRSGP